jgi:hypothetical protein
MSDKYKLYLAADCWRKQTRPAALARAGYVCQYCGERPATEVHHLTYRSVGQERPHDLLSVCQICHAKLHDLSAVIPEPANDNQLPMPFLFVRKSQS